MSIAQQLAAAAAAPTDTLKHSAMPASWTQLPFRSSAGTWSATAGWSAAGILAGAYYNAAKQVGPSLSLFTQAESLNPGTSTHPSSIVLWLFAGTTSITGYELSAQLESPGGSKYLITLFRWVNEASALLGEVKGVELLAGKGLALVSTGATKVVYCRASTASAWVPILTAADATLTEGFSAIDGVNIVPLTNFATGALAAAPLPAAIAGSPAVSASMRSTPGLRSTIAQNPQLAAQLLKGRLTSAAAAQNPQLAAQLLKAKLASSTVAEDPSVTASLDRLPNSQHVFLDFELDRTLVPYTAERG